MPTVVPSATSWTIVLLLALMSGLTTLLGVVADGSSRMGDDNDLLTVRELLDLVEFLKGVR